MIPDRDGCRAQILRFSGLPGWPKRPEGVQELVDVAQNAFQTLAALTRAIDSLQRTAKRCVVPSDLYEMAATVYEQGTSGAYTCTVCYDSGRIYAPVLFTWESGGRVRKQWLLPQQADAIRSKSQAGELEAIELEKLSGTKDERARNAERARDVRNAKCLQLNKQMIYEFPKPCRCRETAA